MIVLGITGEHDASACLIKDGKLIAMCEEERFSRIKHHCGFPYKSIDFVLKKAKLSSEDIAYVAIADVEPLEHLKLWLRHYIFNGNFLLDGRTSIKNVLNYPAHNNFRVPIKTIKTLFKNAEIHFVEHHLCHASSSFYCSGFRESSVVTFDAWGDLTTVLLSKANNEGFDEIKRIKGINSLGFMYANVSKYLGYYKGIGHEGKVMGLAAYGEPVEDFSGVIDTSNVFFETVPSTCYGRGTKKQLEKCFGESHKNPFDSYSKKHLNVAATLQARFEEAIENLIKHTIAVTGIKDVCLAGGVALNCKSNGEIQKSGLVDNLFIVPAAGDGGKSVGAAMFIFNKLKQNTPRFKLEHAFYGPSFSNEEIEQVLLKSNLDFDKHKNISKVAAEMIFEGKVIGWFQGGMEFGPRALGNRSILANPCLENIKDVVNGKVKARESWRPFAPSVLKNSASEYFENCFDSPFMLKAFYTVENKKKEIPSVVHFDGTSRPQTVSRDVNKKYFDLIKSFENLSSVPMVLNTSFNKREPIVCSPNDAIKTFSSTGLDALAIGDFLVFKSQ